mgnify:CR=1 FL=1
MIDFYTIIFYCLLNFFIGLIIGLNITIYIVKSKISDLLDKLDRGEI